jgi:hypothetical protein
MTTAFMIPFNEILEKAFSLRDQQPDLTIDELIKEILPTINIKIQSDVNMNIRKKVISDEEKIRKKTEIAEDERCMSRTVYEDKHLEESGFLKVMRDDIKNLYGDRCKCRKKDGSLFCTRHSGFQPLGVWNGKYYGKLLDLVNKTINGETCQILEDGEEPPVPKVKTVKEKKTKPVHEKMVRPSKKEEIRAESNDVLECLENAEDSDSVIAYPIIIDEKEYNIDEENKVWTDDGDLIGIYDRIEKKWIAKM